MRVLVLASAACLVAAFPASAQIWGGPVPSSVGGSFAGRGIHVPAQARSARSEIRAGARSGQLTRGEARRLGRADVVNGNIAERLARGGLTQSEVAELETRAILLHEDIVRARFDGDAKPPNN
ncbi:hypothetical protein CA233_18040 [Sphingomonas sp. ABOLD]|uniref:Oligomerization/nucleic acid binding protein n=1 Tax=Sphingomonas trueperi TaxID=53317 RepID=A0A7X5XYL3_9SPHN|nr:MULTISPECIES: hypothetical protein [Sphingomonas]NJB97375.1 hypothetical protein [Sphingomonas trueperi]RSV41852.1 hypothetical protein CA233_18040 [Sphingomonas sp. ABOLD]